MNEAQAAKSYWRQNHHQSPRLVDGQPHRMELAEHISPLAPAGGRILEFGCSSGRNLATLRLIRPDLELVGIDMNEKTVSLGRDAHPTVAYILGDEAKLRELPDGYADVVLSCSVLDHVPAPEWRAVYDELVRAARVAVVLLEPMYRQVVIDELADGAMVDSSRWLEADFHDLRIPAPEYTYAHDYLGHDPLLRLVRHAPVTGLEQWGAFGNCYCLMERTCP